jgi:hypothetical protein
MSDAAGAAPASAPTATPASAPGTSTQPGTSAEHMGRQQQPQARPSDFRDRMAQKDAEFAKRVQSERFGAKPRAGSEREHITELGDRLTKQTQLETPAPEPSTNEFGEPQEGEHAEQESPLEEPAPPIDPQVALEKFKEWSDSPDLPKDFYDKLIEVPWGPHGTKLVPISEMQKGYQRLGESTRAYQEVQKREQAVKQSEQAYQQHFEAIHDPEQFLEIYERNGYSDVLYKVAESIARREQTDNRLIEAAGYAAMREHQCQATDHRVAQAMDQARASLQAQRGKDVELRKVQAERDRLRQQHQQVDEQAAVKELGEKYRAQLGQLVPIAFKAHQIKDNPVNRAKHHRHLTDIMQATGAVDITRQVVMDATEMLLEELHDARVQPANGNGARPLSPNRLGTGMGDPRGPNANKPSGARMTDFHANMARKNQGR